MAVSQRPPSWYLCYKCLSFCYYERFFFAFPIFNILRKAVFQICNLNPFYTLFCYNVILLYSVLKSVSKFAMVLACYSEWVAQLACYSEWVSQLACYSEWVSQRLPSFVLFYECLTVVNMRYYFPSKFNICRNSIFHSCMSPLLIVVA